MKKILLSTSLLISLFALRSQAQSFKLQSDTVRNTYAGHSFELHNDITSTSSSTIKVSWKVVSTDFPKSWLDQTGLCDNLNCYNNGANDFSNGTTFVSDNISAGANANFDMQIADLSAVPNGTHYLTVQLSNGSTQRFSTFVVSKSANGVVSVSRVDNDVLLYPIPAHNEVNVAFNGALGIRTVTLYNLIGKSIASKHVNDNTAQFDVDNLPAGVYFVRLADAQGNVVATRRFTHQ